MLNLLDNNTLVLDGSAFSEWNRCHALYGYRHGRSLIPQAGEGLTPSTTSVPLAAGTAVHAGVGKRYQLHPNGLPPFPASRRKIHADINASLKKLSAEWDWRNPAYVHALVDAYIDRWGAENFHALEVEAPFSRIVGEFRVDGKVYRLMWQGRRDLTIRYHSSDTEWVMDHKTASGASSAMEVRWGQNPSQLGYVWARGELTGRLPMGFIMNQLVWSKPTDKQRKKVDDGSEGGGSWKTIRVGKQFARVQFSRHPILVQPHQIEEWKQTVLDTARDIITAAKAGRWSKNGSACFGYGMCPFFRPCVLPVQERERFFATTNNYQPYTWSPLNEEDE